jgi:uncharacterized protein YabE (DUF348 family)
VRPEGGTSPFGPPSVWNHYLYIAYALLTVIPVTLTITPGFRCGVLKTKSQNRSLLLTREASILSNILQTLQAPATSTFRKVLLGFAGLGLSVVVVGLVTGLIPPPKHVLADSSRIVSIYFDGQKKIITTEATTVGQVLAQSGVQLAQGDSVEPGINSQVPAGFFNINVYRARPVVVVDGNSRVTVHTASQSPRLIAQAAGLTVYPEDSYTLDTINEVATYGVVGQRVVVHRAIPVIIRSDGRQTLVRTQQKSVDGLLNERDVALGADDTVEPARGAVVTPNMTITINRVTVSTVKQTVAIARTVQTIKDSDLTIGTTKVQVEGNDGQKVLTYRIHYQNGIEQRRELLDQQQILDPVTKVVVVGTKIDYSADPVELGRQLAAQRGWTGDQWNALYKLWLNESNWNPGAKNFFSGACGIPQAYPCSKMSDRSVTGQINWGLSYIASKYGSPSAAWSYWQQNNSY